MRRLLTRQPYPFLDLCHGQAHFRDRAGATATRSALRSSSVPAALIDALNRARAEQRGRNVYRYVYTRVYTGRAAP